MNFENYFPKFKVVEPNLSTGLHIGQYLSQVKCAKATVANKVVNTAAFLENGVIVGLDNTGTVVNFDATKHAVPFIVYNDPITTGPLNGKNQYAMEFEEDVCYPRGIALLVGDTWTLDNFTGTPKDNGFAKVTNGIITLQDVADAETLFYAKKTKLPANQTAVEITYIGTPLKKTV